MRHLVQILPVANDLRAAKINSDHEMRLRARSQKLIGIQKTVGGTDWFDVGSTLSIPQLVAADFDQLQKAMIAGQHVRVVATVAIVDYHIGWSRVQSCCDPNY